MNFSSLVNVCSYQKHCYRQKPPDCLDLMILEVDLLFALMRTLTEFNTSVIVVTKMITYKWWSVVFCSGCMTDLPMAFFTERF